MSSTPRPVRLLAIETSTRAAGIAAFQGGELLREYVLDPELSTASALAPSLKQLLNLVGWRSDEVDVVSASVGPGSFTGLRLGVTTAKVFAYAVHAQVVGVDTLAVLAESVPAAGRLWSIIDAQRNQLYTASFEPAPGGTWRQQAVTSIEDVAAWRSRLAPRDMVVGPPLESLHNELPQGVVAAPRELWQPTAAAVGRIAWRKYERGQLLDPMMLSPAYYRPSAAEERFGKG